MGISVKKYEEHQKRQKNVFDYMNYDWGTGSLKQFIQLFILGGGERKKEKKNE